MAGKRDRRWQGLTAGGMTAVLCLLPLFPCRGEAAGNYRIAATRHNLSVTGPGDIKALNEDRICIFCHTPHNAAPRTPLWNKELKAQNYETYTSSTLGALPGQPSGPSRLCLSCHDGTVALGAVLQPVEGIEVVGEISLGNRSYLGKDISDDHPVVFSYLDSLPNSELASPPPEDLLFYGNYHIHCTTCHNPHDDTYGNFLAADNLYAALCNRCHEKENWIGSSHALSASTWNGIGANPWPAFADEPGATSRTVAEHGCQNCHAVHAAGGAQRLLNYQQEEQNCFSCHNSNVAAADIEGEFLKTSAHQLGRATGAHDPTESPQYLDHVECVDCHNPHVVTNQTAEPPFVSGRLRQVSGLDGNGVAVSAATYEYEICFKCHEEVQVSYHYTVIQRYVETSPQANSTRLEFSAFNSSYHPVTAQGRNPDVPSLPSTYEPGLTASSLIYCTDCHDSNDSPRIGGTGPRGPHGSDFVPLLRQRYETDDQTPESFENYALCYRCHDRNSILANESFQQRGGRGGHSGHLGAAVPCAVCHDPHGVPEDGFHGDQTHLINFATLVVSPPDEKDRPIFLDLGTRAGSCILVCHGVSHTEENSSYPF